MIPSTDNCDQIINNILGFSCCTFFHPVGHAEESAIETRSFFISAWASLSCPMCVPFIPFSLLLYNAYSLNFGFSNSSEMLAARHLLNGLESVSVLEGRCRYWRACLLGYLVFRCVFTTYNYAWAIGRARSVFSLEASVLVDDLARTSSLTSTTNWCHLRASYPGSVMKNLSECHNQSNFPPKVFHSLCDSYTPPHALAMSHVSLRVRGPKFNAQPSVGVVWVRTAGACLGNGTYKRN